MIQIVFNEIDSWPSFFQTVFSYLKKATVVVPVMAVLGYGYLQCTLDNLLFTPFSYVVLNYSV